ncbi:MAG: helix-turn-helix domain-containing protein, partial [Pseudomonadota bacterium]
WKPGILYHLRDKTFRFGELKREMPGITEAVLARQLKELEKDGIILRRDHREVPPRVDYSLTEYGVSVVPVIDVIANWGLKHLEREAKHANRQDSLGSRA